MKLFIAISCVLISSVFAKPETTCEFESITMECKGSKVIQMTSAFWGRKEIHVCKEQAVPGGGCSIGNALSRLQTMCNGKQSCTVEADNKNFGDPCWGTYKYMITDFTCVVGGSADICEDNSLEISCPGKTLLEIGDAFYGRQTEDICDNVGVPLFGCDMGDAKKKAADLCNGKQSCTIEANNGFFGDPCWLVRKYAQVSYICPKLSTMQVCQYDTQELSCPEGRKLRIRKASYGRFDSEVCAHAGVPTAGCSSKAANKLVKKACNNKNSCSLTASDDVFGDPCWGTLKYLEVVYQCK